MFNNFTETELSHEQWRDIDGYDGMYQVSDLGRVRSHKSGEWKVRKPVKSNKGYLTIQLHKNNNKKTYSIHRLVAQAFIENNDETKTQINHRDECKQNNRLWNLEYCTPKYNNTYNGLQYRRHHQKHKLNKVKHLYNPNLTYNENLEIFRENGIECSVRVINSIRKDLDLIGTNRKYVRNKIKDIYDPELSINENLEIFKSNGIECNEKTVRNLRKDLGLKTSRPKYVLNEIKDLYDQNLNYEDNLKVFKENGVECSRSVIFNIRKQLGLVNQQRKYN